MSLGWVQAGTWKRTRPRMTGPGPLTKIGGRGSFKLIILNRNESSQTDSHTHDGFRFKAGTPRDARGLMSVHFLRVTSSLQEGVPGGEGTGFAPFPTPPPIICTLRTRASKVRLSIPNLDGGCSGSLLILADNQASVHSQTAPARRGQTRALSSHTAFRRIPHPWQQLLHAPTFLCYVDSVLTNTFA